MGINLAEKYMKDADTKEPDKIVVCVLDAMVDISCNGIDPNRIKIIDEISSPKALIYDEKNGHGNAVCSIIHQINKYATVYLFPVTSGESVFRINSILKYICENRRASIINMSFGFYASSNEVKSLETTCFKLMKNNIDIVAANSSMSLDVYPASFSSVIGVSLGKSDEYFNIDIMSKKNISIIVNEAESEVWWRKNYVIPSRAASFSAARISALLSLAIQEKEPENTIYLSSWRKITEWIKENKRV